MNTQPNSPGIDYPWPVKIELCNLKPLNEVGETAEYLRCGRTHVFHLIKTGELSSIKLGKKRLISAEAIHVYVRSRTARSTA